jgi:coenzyme F420-reducing hydrogenase delta subunit
MSMNEKKDWTPKIVAFCCNWCSYSSADTAGNNRAAYPENVKIIRVPCSCRINPIFNLRAFQRGATCLVMGCHRRMPLYNRKLSYDKTYDASFVDA